MTSTICMVQKHRSWVATSLTTSSSSTTSEKTSTAILSQTPLHNNNILLNKSQRSQSQKLRSRKETKTIIVLYLQKYVRTHAHPTSPLSACPLEPCKISVIRELSVDLFCSIRSLISELLLMECVVLKRNLRCQ